MDNIEPDKKQEGWSSAAGEEHLAEDSSSVEEEPLPGWGRPKAMHPFSEYIQKRKDLPSILANRDPQSRIDRI